MIIISRDDNVLLQKCEDHQGCDHVEVTFDNGAAQVFSCALKESCGAYPAAAPDSPGTSVFYIRRTYPLPSEKLVLNSF